MIDLPLELSDRDLFPGEGVDRFAEARARFRGTEVRDPEGAAFAEAYGAMAAYFEPKNEIERREILQDWLRRPITEGRLRITYQLLAWHDASGALVGVRDCFVGVDVERALAGVLLSHSFVPPAHRRSGVATLIRTIPADLARREVARWGLDPEATPIVLCAEMEPCVPTDRGSIVRLLSYGRAGYSSVPAAILPYCQPDFRDLAALGVPAEPIPMPFVVRWLGHEADGVLPTVLADTLLESFATLHLRACEPTHVTALVASDRAGLVRYGADQLPLIRLPTQVSELERLEPVLRSRVLPHYPARFHRAADTDELAELRAARLLMGG